MLGSVKGKTSAIIKGIKKEITNNKNIYTLLGVILILAFFVRTYRLDKLLGFYYDQGRDAKVIWDLWHNYEPFLIGPVTGLAGIFLGPFFYYMIAPFYILGGGNPVFPAVFLSFLSTLAVLFTYLLGWKINNRWTGIIAAIITSFSYYLILAGRWLSNPTPILLTSVILFWSLWELVNDGDKKWWIVAAFLIGLSLQFESASAVFYIPILIIFALWKYYLSVKKKSKFELFDKKVLFYSLGLFLLTLLPQILFNFRHENILLNNFINLFTEKKSFSINIGEVLNQRLSYFWSVYSSKIIVGKPHYAAIFSLFSFSAMLYYWRELYKKRIIHLFAIFFIVPAIGYILFQGNYGNIYDYYLTGYYNIFVLFFAIGLGLLWRSHLGKIVVITFLLIFLKINVPLAKNYLVAGVDGPTHISLGNEMQAVDWILRDSRGRGPFNTSFYVPPVIPHTYEYLMTWQTTSRCGADLCGWERQAEEELVYVLYEKDPPHPERLRIWLEDRKDNTEILKEQVYGGITVQRRKRL